MGVLDQVEPKKVFHFFEEICQIPHGSRNTKQISDFLAAFAAQRHLECHQDSSNNIIIFKAASEGYESSAPVILQGHMDMVCEKAPECQKDMEKEGLNLVLEGDTVYAKGTTLGADDGIAVAMGLALLDDDTIAHPPLEIVFTVDEEIDMLGANTLDVGLLKGRRLINLDSEEEGIFTVGCAGGATTQCNLPIAREKAGGKAYSVKVAGLVGGHSGAEIHKGHVNANGLLARTLLHLTESVDYSLISFTGGRKDNAIPVEAEAILVAEGAAGLSQACKEFAETLHNELRVREPGVTLTVSPAAAEELPMTKESRDRVLCLLTSLPNGVQVMSADIPGLVQTSLNLGVVRTEQNQLTARSLLRSSLDSEKHMLIERTTSLAALLQGRVEVSNEYPGWEYAPVSPLRDLFVQVYQEQYGNEPRVETIHAGLECGLFASKLPGLDCVSLGPTLTDIHTYRERLHIASIQRTWNLVLEVLKRLK